MVSKNNNTCRSGEDQHWHEIELQLGTRGKVGNGTLFTLLPLLNFMCVHCTKANWEQCSVYQGNDFPATIMEPKLICLFFFSKISAGSLAVVASQCGNSLKSHTNSY